MGTQRQATIRRLETLAILIFTVAPAIYLFAAIQYSAIIYPYWDHLVFVKYLSAYYDGTLLLSDLFEPQAQTRPFLPRLILLANAVATKWDVRSEFIFLHLTIFGTLIVHFYALRRLSHNLPALPFMAAAALVSIFVCSPVGNTNHWWSLMFLETLALLLITISLIAVALNQNSWSANIVAAFIGWLAAYSLSSGLFVFAAIFATHQLASPKPFVPNRWGAFWLANFVCICAVYIPGLDLRHGNPLLLDLVRFFFVYLGNPLGSLLWFPFSSPFDLPLATRTNAVVGIFLTAATIFTLHKARADLQAKRPEAFILFSFTAFALISTIVTAWGRAGFGVHGAQSPRYSAFAVYLILGLIYYFSGRFARRGWSLTTLPLRGYVHLLVLGVFFVLSTITYVRAIPIYRIAHDFNQVASNAYAPYGVATELDKQIFPDITDFQTAKATLYRLGLGPYRFRSLESVPRQ